jgi:hypothetical protein
MIYTPVMLTVSWFNIALNTGMPYSHAKQTKVEILDFQHDMLASPFKSSRKRFENCTGRTTDKSLQISKFAGFFYG